MADLRPFERARRIIAVALGVGALAVAGAGCGSGDGGASSNQSPPSGTPDASTAPAGAGAPGKPPSATTPSPAPSPADSLLTATALTGSFSRATIGFASRRGSVLRASVDRSLGKRAAIAVKPGSAECRPASATPSVSDPQRFPFACIVSGTAASGGVSTAFTLGFVVFHVDGRCWRATNERISAAASGPLLIPQRQAFKPPNVVAGCASA